MLVTRLYSSNGSAIEVTDFCPRFERRRPHVPPADAGAARAHACRHAAHLRAGSGPSFGYGAIAPAITHGSNHVRYVSPDRVLRLTTDAPVSYVLAETPFLLENGVSFVLGADETLDRQRGTDMARDLPGSRRRPTGASGRAGLRSRRNGRRR